MANWKEYTTKTAVEDTDELMIADATANANKRTPLSILWNWIAGKLATAVISQLETQNKSIIPALNELNSKAQKLFFINAIPGITEAPIDMIARDIIDNQLPNNDECFYFVSFTSGSRYRMIVQKFISNDYAAYILFGYAKAEISYHVKTNGIWR
jgi:hypothetical protein